MKTLQTILRNQAGHWVGDGFPVRTLFDYQGDTTLISPFLLLDFAGPRTFESREGRPRGVGQHPHRGFETVTIVYDGEVSHRDSTGGGGTIGAGEVQWMTAGAGIVHEEFHSPEYSRNGGPFQMVQLWVNLPRKDKMTSPGYQAITRDTIPDVALAGGRVRVIAGAFEDTNGPARTFSPVNVWDVRLAAGAVENLPLPKGHTSMVAVLSGTITVEGKRINEAEIARFSLDDEGVKVTADTDTVLLVMTGEPIDEPVVGHGPFVMNSETEIRQAFTDFQSGRFGAMPT